MCFTESIAYFGTKNNLRELASHNCPLSLVPAVQPVKRYIVY
jgi:hypothetical protein